MSMSTHIIGIKPPDSKWLKMKAAWDACEKADIKIPKEVDDFFDGITPDKKGVVIDLESNKCCKEWHEESSSGHEIDLSKLPKDIKIIRFFNSW